MRQFIREFLGLDEISSNLSEMHREMMDQFWKAHKNMALNAHELQVALNAATDEVANDLTDLREAVAAAVADKDEAVQTAVQEALAGFEAPIARLHALAQDPENPAPPAEDFEPVV